MSTTLYCGFILYLALTAPLASALDLQFKQISPRGSVVDIRHAGDGSGRLFLVEQTGRVRVISDGMQLQAPFLDIRDRVSEGGERGLLSLAFAPDYASTGHFYTWYTDLAGATVLSRFKVSANPNLVNPASQEILLTVSQPFGNHNGGRILFGPDGYLYVGLGDGGGAGDPGGNGQWMQTLLGKVLRIDVDPSQGTYAIPADNPFVGDANARDEIWAAGLRNPWKMSFDRMTGDLYIADVGQDAWEEVNFQPAASIGGVNYGWATMEGSSCFESQNCSQTGLTLPVAEYSHSVGCSITGGEVYRGSAYPDLDGLYLYGDFCSGRIWGLNRNGNDWQMQELADTSFNITSFGEDEAGNVYLAARNVGVFLISDGPVKPAFRINAGLNDAWFNAATAGQGLFLIVYPETGVLFVGWFTYDVERPDDTVTAILGEAGHRWLTAQGGWLDSTAVLDLYLTSGGEFDRPDPKPQTGDPIGTMTIEFHDCENATVSYNITSPVLEGVFDITRIALDNVALCEALSQM